MFLKKLKSKLILALVLINILSVTNILWALNPNVITFRQNFTSNSHLKTSTVWTTSNIFVEDDNPTRDWAHYVASFPWCFGSGTEFDPFVIENVSVNAGGTGNCLIIRDSEAYYEVRNCNLTNGDKGIYLDYAHNGKLINNNCSRNVYGIDIEMSDNLTILDNLVKDTSYGLSTYLSDNLIINGNVATEASNDGITIAHSDNSIISYNIASDNNRGIVFGNNFNTTLFNNTVVGNIYEGINIYGSGNECEIKNNFVDGNDIGISLTSASGHTIFNNTVQGSVDSGINVGGGPNIVKGNFVTQNLHGIVVAGGGKEIVENIIVNNNGRGISSEGSYNNYDNNNISYNGIGIYLSGFWNPCIKNNFSNNFISHNVNHGIGFYYDCNNNTILNNEVSHNGGSGILGEQFGEFRYNIIEENLIFDNSWSGFDLLNFHYNYIVGNNITGNHNAGILFFDNCDWNKVLNNFIYDNYQSGIEFNQGCYYNTLDNNTFYMNRNRGIYLEFAISYNNITNNLFEDNWNYGVFVDSDANINIFSGNYFIGNGIHANDSGLNYWNNSLIGNFWDDNLINTDVNDDGIGETPYMIWPDPLIQDYLPIYEDGNDPAPPIISIVNPVGLQMTGKTAPTFQISIAGLYVHTRAYELIGTGQNVTFSGNSGQFDQSLWESFGNGTVTIRFYVNDTGGYGTMDEVTIRKDIYEPNLSISTPLSNTLFDDTSPVFNVEVSDPNLDQMWYTIDGGLNNYTFTTNTSIDQGAWDLALDGYITVEFYAIDTANNLVFDSVIIRKDTTAPSININNPSPDDLFGKSTISFNVEVFDLNLVQMWYTIQGVSMNVTFTANGTLSQALWESVGSGQVTLIFYANDIHGRQSSDSVIITKDIDEPSLVIIEPDSGEIFYLTSPQYEITVNDPNLELVWYTIDGGITNITIYDYFGSIDATEWGSASIGDVTITFYAKDTLGNIAFQEVIVEKRSVSTQSPPPPIPGYPYLIVVGILAFFSLAIIIKLKKKIH